MQENREQGTETFVIEGRNAVLEAFRSGRTIDKIYILDGCQDGPVRTIVREAKKHGSLINFVTKERLSQLSETGKHQGVIAHAAAYEYSTIDDMLKLAEERGEAPFLILLDNIEDPHNLGAIIRTANLAGAHGVSCKDICRSFELYTGRKGDESCEDNGRTQGKRTLVCMC